MARSGTGTGQPGMTSWAPLASGSGEGQRETFSGKSSKSINIFLISQKKDKRVEKIFSMFHLKVYFYITARLSRIR